MNKSNWIKDCISKNGSLDIKTDGGYTFEQIMDNKNCSKDISYWYNIAGTEKFLFKSSVAESWEFFDNTIVNPIRNTNQIYLRFLRISDFIPAANYYRKYGVYTHHAKGTLAFNNFWMSEEKKCLNGIVVDGVYITGRYYFSINFGTFKAFPVDEFGDPIGKRKQITLLRFIDVQYYLFHELEEVLLSGNYSNRDKYLEWFPTKTRVDFAELKYDFFAASKGRRKGWSAVINSGGIVYNFVFLAESKTIIGSEEKAHYNALQKGIKETRNTINKHTPWKRPTGILGRADHFITGIKTELTDGTVVEEGYKSEVQFISFPDAYKGIGDSAELIVIEEPGKFTKLIETLKISIEPVLREGDSTIGPCVLGGCVCKGTEVYMGNGKSTTIENITKDTGILGYDGNNPTNENVSWLKPITKKICYRIKTSNGKSIDCSYDHPLLWSKNHEVKMVNGKLIKKVTFKKAEEIQIGDQLMGPSTLSKFGTRKMWNPTLVGLMIGDGSYGGNGSDQLYVGEEEIYQWIKDNGIKNTIIKQFITKKGNIYRSLSLSNVRGELRKLGIYGQTKDRKTLPLNIHEYDKDSIAKLIGGYFDADGNVNYDPKKDQVRVRLTCKYKPILKDVQKLLVKFGITSNIEKSTSKSGYKPNSIRYDLVIYKQYDVALFQDNIPLICIHKNKILSNLNRSKAKLKRYDECAFEINKSNGKGEFFINKTFKDLFSETVTDIIHLGEQDVYNLTADTTHTYVSNGFISSNTAGDMESGGSIALQEIMYHPKAYGFKEYDNIYEEVEVNTKSGWFIDDLWFLSKTISKEALLKLDNSKLTQQYCDRFEGDLVYAVDKYGNSYRHIAKILLMSKREREKLASREAYQNHITQQPMYLSEAFLVNTTSPFDIGLAKEALMKLYSTEDKIPLEKGKFMETKTVNGVSVIEWKLDMSLNHINRYPWKSPNKEGCWVIYSHPVKSYKYVTPEEANEAKRLNPGDPNAGRSEYIEPFRYIAGIDPIDWGTGETSNVTNAHSLASTWVIDTYTRQIVAEYVSRPYSSDMYFEELRKGLEYFNAIANPETNLKGLVSYFKAKNKSYLLCDELQSLKDKLNINPSKNPTKGTKATPKINNAARELIHRWSTEMVRVGQDDNGNDIEVPRMMTIQSISLLEEMIKWTHDGNFDNISGLGMAMLLLFDKDYSLMHKSTVSEDRFTKGLFKQVRNNLKKRNLNYGGLHTNFR